MATKKVLSLSDRSEEIRKWQITTSEGGSGTTVPTAIMSTLYDALMGFLKIVLDHARRRQPTPSYYSSLEDDAAALLFWGCDFGVSQGELDVALQYSHRLRDTVLTVLVSLGDLLSLGLLHVITTRKEREALIKTSKLLSLTEDARLLLDEPTEPAEYDGEDIERLCLTLHSITGSLEVLCSSLESIADDEFDDEEARTWVNLQDRSAHEYFVDLVNSRFPSAEKQLVQNLGQTNWNRYNYVQKLRKSARVDLAPSETDKAKSEFHDSGIGSSAPEQSVVIDDHSLVVQPEYAATNVSSRAEVSHKRLPLLPEGARSGEPFECEVCNRILQIRRTREWKKHIFEDICAYTCIFSECPSNCVLFKDRDAMTDHLVSHHGITEDSSPQECPLCLEKITEGRDSVLIHFTRHMEEIALGVLTQGADSAEGSEESDDESEQQIKHASHKAISETSDDTQGRELVENLSQEDLEEEELSEVKCICGYSGDDGNTVLCEKCVTWQHILCYYESIHNVPDVHECQDCLPQFRDIDRTYAAEKQKNRLEKDVIKSAGNKTYRNAKPRQNARPPRDVHGNAEFKTWQCTFCGKYVLPKSWRRHEETQHRSSAKWTCMLYGPRITTGSGDLSSCCAFCMDKDPSEEHFLHSHRIADCAARPATDRTFNRPDHLRQHVKNWHETSLFDITAAKWKVEPSAGESWTCGFCGQRLGTWDKRAFHVAAHFKNGMTMEQWSDYSHLNFPSTIKVESRARTMPNVGDTVKLDEHEELREYLENIKGQQQSGKRRTTACIACASAKAKCDMAVPSCSRCTMRDLHCKSRPMDPPSSDDFITRQHLNQAEFSASEGLSLMEKTEKNHNIS